MPYRNDGARVQDGEGAHRALHGQSHASATSTRTARELRPPPSLVLSPRVCVTRLLSVCSRCRNYVVLSRLGLGLRPAEQRSWPHLRSRAALAAGRGAPDACCWRSGGGGGGLGPRLRGRHAALVRAASSWAPLGNDARPRLVRLRVGRPPRQLAAGTVATLPECVGCAALWSRRGLASCRVTTREQKRAVAVHADRVQGHRPRGRCRHVAAVDVEPGDEQVLRCRGAWPSLPPSRNFPSAAGVSSALRTTWGQRGTVDVSVGMPCRRRGTRDGATAGATTRRRTGDGGTLEADAPC